MFNVFGQIHDIECTNPQCYVASLKIPPCKIEIGNTLYDQFPNFTHIGCKTHGKQHNYIVNGNVENVPKKTP